MSPQMTLSLFPTRSSQGLALQEQLVWLAEERGFTIKVYQNADSMKYIEACDNDDVVILDASREVKGQHNYDFALPMAMDHVLVVSRSYLPLNFYGERDSIFDEETKKEIYGAPQYPKTQSNEDIQKWVELQIADLLPQLPRPNKGRLLSQGVLRALILPALTGKSSVMSGVDEQDKRRKQSGQVFISYRNTDGVALEVAKLAERITTHQEFHDVPTSVRYFPPEVLSAELMPEQRRWQILSWIDRFIGPANEVWVYETEEYYNSWWTIGELATLAYRQKDGYRGMRPPKIRIFNPDTGVLRDAPDDYLPKMTVAQMKRMARMYASCDTMVMGPESIITNRLFASLPLVGKLPYFRDRVWSREFWEDPILDCGKDRIIGKNGSKFNVDDFIEIRGPGFFRFPASEIKAYISQGSITCLRCATVYKIRQSPPHYLWMPVVNGHRTGEYWMAMFGIEPEEPDEYSLVPLTVYQLVS